MIRLLVVALLVAGCGGAAPSPSPAPVLHRIAGTFVLTDTKSPEFRIAGPCQGVGGYSDIVAGLGVTLKDQAGTILATSTLVAVPRTKSPSWDCPFSFTLSNVPDTATFYAVEVGHRGSITKSHAEMEAAAWTFDLTLGS